MTTSSTSHTYIVFWFELIESLIFRRLRIDKKICLQNIKLGNLLI